MARAREGSAVEVRRGNPAAHRWAPRCANTRGPGPRKEPFMDKSEANTTDAPADECKTRHAEAAGENVLEAFLRDLPRDQDTNELREVLERVAAVVARHGDVLTVDACSTLYGAMEQLVPAGVHARQDAQDRLELVAESALHESGRNNEECLQAVARAYRAVLHQWEAELSQSLQHARGYLDCIEESLASGKVHPVVSAYVARARTTGWAPELATDIEARVLDTLMTATVAGADPAESFDSVGELCESVREGSWSGLVAARLLNAATVALDGRPESTCRKQEAHDAA